MNTYKHLLYIALCFLLLTGCQRGKKVTLATNIKTSVWHENGKILAESMAKYGWQIEVLAGPEYGPEKNVGLIKNNEVDFALVNNSNIFSEDNINTVTSLNTEVLLILHRGNHKEYISLNQLVMNKKVLLPEKNSESRRIISRVFAMLDLELDEANITYMDTKKMGLHDGSWLELVNNQDVVISFSELSNPQVRRLLNEGWHLYSGGRVDNYQKGSLVDAFCYQYPWAYPFLVPRKIFGMRQEKRLNTIGIKSLIVTNEVTDPMLVYDFLRDFNQSLPIISKKRVAFAESRYLDRTGLLGFPLHKGAVRYRDRDKPKFVERYAELIAMIVTLFAVGSGLIAQYIRRLRQIKKDHIDHYYSKLLEAKNLQELDEIRLKAIQQLQNEYLEANESFLIFLTLYEELKAELPAKVAAT